MHDFIGLDGEDHSSVIFEFSAGGALRREILGKITHVLRESNSIEDSSRRLLIQACCLDVITALEDLIKSFKLDGHMLPK